ncbi:Rrp15p-domain-containing protein [Crucibulum laeve]|uniref:Rrp15p-domain-containing protein n=1 Tax=Crucibulum laeve TaxID=68775 RepID=A0A5C3MJ94_9AGAR|nr:Rrp15p-domain-containing protein [Crucibulum laeve]
MPPSKRQKLSDAKEEPARIVEEEVEVEMEQGSDGFASDSGSEDAGTSSDSEDEVVPKRQKSKQTTKRKIRATAPSNFGATLQSLLNTDAPSALPLSLKPSIARKRNDEKLELRAKKVLQVERKEKEDKGRIRDVIGGWGGESERALRKVAQRGVVKLFNMIQQSQSSASATAEEMNATKGSGKPSLPAPSINSKGKAKGKKRDNIIGRGKESAVEKDDFFDMIRSGGLVSKA